MLLFPNGRPLTPPPTTTLRTASERKVWIFGTSSLACQVPLNDTGKRERSRSREIDSHVSAMASVMGLWQGNGPFVKSGYMLLFFFHFCGKWSKKPFSKWCIIYFGEKQSKPSFGERVNIPTSFLMKGGWRGHLWKGVDYCIWGQTVNTSTREFKIPSFTT